MSTSVLFIDSNQFFIVISRRIEARQRDKDSADDDDEK